MAERARQRQAEMDIDEKAREMDPNASVSLNLIVKSAILAGKDDVLADGKILLPPSALETCIASRIAFPVTFELRPVSLALPASSPPSLSPAASPTSSPRPDISSADAPHMDGEASFIPTGVAYAGVHSFDGPANTVVIPASIMELLNVDEGARVVLRNVNLSRGTFVK
jgi:hypothetical protein